MTYLRQKLPVTYLLLTRRGRISRSTYWHASILIWCLLFIIYTGLKHLFGPAGTWLVYPPFFWTVFTTSSKRLHDVGKSGLWLLTALIPVLGPAYLLWQLLFRRGQLVRNQFGRFGWRRRRDYQRNDDGIPDADGEGTKWTRQRRDQTQSRLPS